MFLKISQMVLLATCTFLLAGLSPAMAVTPEPQKDPVELQEPLPQDPDMVPLPPIEPLAWLPPMEPLTALLLVEPSTPLPEKPAMDQLPDGSLPAPPMPPNAKIIDPPESPQPPEDR